LFEDFNANIGTKDILKTRLGTTGYMKLVMNSRSTHSPPWVWLFQLLIPQHKDVKTLRRKVKKGKVKLCL
jgi:hypothetical protein